MKRSFLVGNYGFGGSFLDSACKIGYTIYRKGAVRNGQLPPANKSIRMTAHVWRLRAVISFIVMDLFEDCPRDLKRRNNCAANDDEQLEHIIPLHAASPLSCVRGNQQ